MSNQQSHLQHAHSHAHAMTKQALRVAFFLTLIILLVECVGGILGNSLALLSDAGHVVTDIFALGLAWFAARQAERPANARKTFGYHRVGILAALLNALTLIAIALVITWEAIGRFQHPETVQPVVMFIAPAIGIVVNLYIGFGLRKEQQNLNVRAATLHVFGDVAASAGVMLAGVIILLSGWNIVDPLLSVGIAALIAFGALSILRETIDILLEAVPKGIALPELVQDMKQVDGVEDVHDLHVWSIASGVSALSAHILIADLPPSGSSPILQSLTGMLSKKYAIDHTTIQFECSQGAGACCENVNLYCRIEIRKDACNEHDHAAEMSEGFSQHVETLAAKAK